MEAGLEAGLPVLRIFDPFHPPVTIFPALPPVSMAIFSFEPTGGNIEF
jgi:hypothetical protein